MRNSINIKGKNQMFKYLLDYTKGSLSLDGHNLMEGDDIIYCNDKGVIRLFRNDINYYRNLNDWYHINKLEFSDIRNYIPETVHTSNIKIYIPSHAVSTYVKNIKYAITANTWINGVKIDLGSFIFSPVDTYAIHTGPIKSGNNEYYEYISFDIIDPFYLLYSDEWDVFRKQLCHEKALTNNTSSALNISMHVIEEYDNAYMIHNDFIGGYTTFSISNEFDYLGLKIDYINTPAVGLQYTVVMNEVYDSLIEYLTETYSLTEYTNINIEACIKNKSGIIADNVSLEYNSNTLVQNMLLTDIVKSTAIAAFFNSWNNFEEGWSFIGSMTMYNNNEELFTIISNELPITQEIFSIFTNGGSEKIIDIADMNINTFNVVNKIENNIIQLERPNESKSNIVQPVFFRTKETETLTLHPVVTENISINLDDYKSKVERFILQIGDNQFEQIGANSYGILFKIPANTLSKTISSGIYYILNENKELVTTGKYSSVL